MATPDTNRLDRIEAKIDQLSEAFISLARTEEKLAIIERDRLELSTKMSEVRDKVDKIDKKTDENTRTISVINKLFWIIIAAGAGAYTVQFLA